MAEATKTLPVQFSMKKGQGRGSRILAMKCTIAATTDTITTPLKTIHAAKVTRVGTTQVAAAQWESFDIVSIADGVISVAGWRVLIPGMAGNILALAGDFYLIAIGSTKEYAT